MAKIAENQFSLINPLNFSNIKHKKHGTQLLEFFRHNEEKHGNNIDRYISGFDTLLRTKNLAQQ